MLQYCEADMSLVSLTWPHQQYSEILDLAHFQYRKLFREAMQELPQFTTFLGNTTRQFFEMLE